MSLKYILHNCHFLLYFIPFLTFKSVLPFGLAHPVLLIKSKEIVAESKVVASVGSGGPSSTTTIAIATGFGAAEGGGGGGGGAETPTKRRSGKKEKGGGGGGAQSVGHSSVASPTPSGSASPQPSSAAAAGERHPPESASGSAAAPAVGVPAAGDDQRSDYRVAIFGAGGVGKSALVQRFIKNTFSDAYMPTIEDTYQQVITCVEQGRMAVCTLHIIDTTGSHQFPAMQRLAMQRGNGFILVYSITSRQSLEELGPIVRTLREVKGEAAIVDVPVVLVGNKSDDQGRREVNQETGEALAQRWGCGFVETSAKQGRNVTEMFQRLLSLEKRRQLTLNVSEIDDNEKGHSGANCTKKQRKCIIV